MEILSEQILFEDQHVLVLHKPAGMPVQPDKTGTESLLEKAQRNLHQPLFVVHRLDLPVSGLVIFAKTKAAAASLSLQFSERTTRKTYLAVVANPPHPQQGDLIHYFEKNAHTNKSHAYAEDQPEREQGLLHYRLIAPSERYHLLDIQLFTGRHHQIRAQLAAIGSPIKGDVKYGARRSNPDRSIHLHAWKLSIHHPTTKELLQLECPPNLNDPLWADLWHKIKANK